MQTALNARFGVARPATRAAGARRSAVQPVRAAAATEKEMTDDLGFKLMRRGVKVAAKESILTPRCDGEGRQLPGAPGAPNHPTWRSASPGDAAQLRGWPLLAGRW